MLVSLRLESQVVVNYQVWILGTEVGSSARAGEL